MKKLTSKITQLLPKRKGAPLEEPAGRITNDTLAEHRQQVLAGGRKFKYPVQYARHRLVMNTIIISVLAVVLLVTLGWYLLYQAQSTSNFMYRVTKVIPAPVAAIEGEQVRYSDFLMKYRSAEHYLTQKEKVDPRTEDGQNQLKFVKEQAMEDAIADAYAAKLAKEMGIEVSNADFEVFLKQQRQSSDGEVSEATYVTVIEDYYGWSLDEYRDAMKSKLLRQKVAYALDTDAQALAQSIETQLKTQGADLNAIAIALNAQKQGAVSYWPDAWVPKTNQDGGLAAAALKLQKGQVSQAIKTTAGDGYYYVKLLDTNETQLQYAYIHVPLSKFQTQLAEIEKGNKLSYFITIDRISETK